MAKGKRTPEQVKIKTAGRLLNGEDEDKLATEFGVAVSTIRDWGKLYGRQASRAKRKVSTNRTISRTDGNPFEKENAQLRKELEQWKEMYLELASRSYSRNVQT